MLVESITYRAGAFSDIKFSSSVSFTEATGNFIDYVFLSTLTLQPTLTGVTVLSPGWAGRFREGGRDKFVSYCGTTNPGYFDISFRSSQNTIDSSNDVFV